MKRFAAELIGTFALVFAGTGAIIVNDVTAGAVTHVGISMVFGLVIAAMIYSVGDISGAHFNPAVTAGFFFARRIDARRVAVYVAAQITGAFAASALLRVIFPTHSHLGTTLPSGPDLQSFALELIMTALLMFVILSVSTGEKEKGVMAGIAVGSVIALEALMGGPISGASMNPARSLAPAIVSGTLGHLWIYLSAPFIGAALAVLGCWCTRCGEGCCGGDPKNSKELDHVGH
jgi:aquaporin NIP